MFLKKLALECASHLYSGTLRIAPRGLQVLNFPKSPSVASRQTPLSHLNISWSLLLPKILYPPMYKCETRV